MFIDVSKWILRVYGSESLLAFRLNHSTQFYFCTRISQISMDVSTDLQIYVYVSIGSYFFSMLGLRTYGSVDQCLCVYKFIVSSIQGLHRYLCTCLRVCRFMSLCLQVHNFFYTMTPQISLYVSTGLQVLVYVCVSKGSQYLLYQD